MPRAKRVIEKDLKLAQEGVAALQIELREALRRTMVPCGSCKRNTVVSSLTYIQTHWWDDNTGSPNGGFWRQGEGQFKCPKCGYENRPINNSFKFKSLKPYFKEVVDEHNRTGW